jgi:membrane-associated phospholipid phosphatase
MQALIDSGISIIVAIQNLGEWLLMPMKLFSELGTEQFFFLVLPMIYWSVDAKLGIRVALVVATSSMFNYVGKVLFASPRPYWVSSEVKAFSAEGSFGMPSGHAQNAVTV